MLGYTVLQISTEWILAKSFVIVSVRILTCRAECLFCLQLKVSKVDYNTVSELDLDFCNKFSE
jgi:hypothetical protein